MVSIGRQFAKFTHDIQYEDLPAPVIDKVKALILHGLAGAILGKQSPDAARAAALVKAEETRADGATLLIDGSKATRVGAAFANTSLLYSSKLFDLYRMLTHPGVVLMPVVLANAELERSNGRHVIEALVAGYEFLCRLCDDVIPSTAARGFRPSPLFCTMGSALAAGKILGFDEGRLVDTIAIAANAASGLNEGPRTGGGEAKYHEVAAARAGAFSALLARYNDTKGSETAIEGPAGFLNAFTGSSEGVLSYSFSGERTMSLGRIVEGLGTDFRLLTVMFRMYATGGFNQPVIDLITEMVKQSHIKAADVESVAVKMNWLETLYPSPEFPRYADFQAPRVDSTKFYAAHAIVNGGVPVVGGRTFGPTGERLADDQHVLEFMKSSVTIVQEKERPMFSPAVTIALKSGKVFKGEYPYARMEWNFDQLVDRLSECFPSPSGKEVFKRLVDLASRLDTLRSMEPATELVHKAQVNASS